jgi:very-short-patch-repair endonuclease
MALENENSSLSISSNEYLSNLFESDIVVRVPIVDGISPPHSKRYLIINIEVDGIHHKREKTKRFCQLRDKYLKLQGVVIERIETSTLRKMKDKDVEKWIQDRVKDAQKLHL